MAVTLNPVGSALVLDTFDSNVELFLSSKAKDIPSKLNAVANDMKAHLNTEIDDVTTYVNEVVVPHLNTEMDKVEADFNTTQTSLNNQQATFETDMTNQQNTFETAFTDSITAQQADYETNLTTGIGSYIIGTGAAYSIEQSNSFVFSGPSDVTYDTDGETVLGYTQGPVTVSNIIYDTNDNLIELTETITVADIPYTKTFTVNYDAKGNLLETVEKI